MAAPGQQTGQNTNQGLTFAQLLNRVPQHTSWAVRHILASEVAAGRVVRDANGGYRLRAAAFPAQVVKALRQLPELDDD